MEPKPANEKEQQAKVKPEKRRIFRDVFARKTSENKDSGRGGARAAKKSL